MMKNKYRIVEDTHAFNYRYIPEIKYWWFPFVWFPLTIARFEKIEFAKKYILKNKLPRTVVVEDLGSFE